MSKVLNLLKCPKDPSHGEMMRNGRRVGRQQWLCNTCGKTVTEKKEVLVDS